MECKHNREFEGTSKLPTQRNYSESFQKNLSEVLLNFSNIETPLTQNQIAKKFYEDIKNILNDIQAFRVPKNIIKNVNLYEIFFDLLIICLNNEEYSKQAAVINTRNYKNIQGYIKKHDMHNYCKSKNELIKTSYFKEFFSNFIHQQIFRYLIVILFEYADSSTLSSWFGFSCCTYRYHSDNCENNWSYLKKYLDHQYLVELDALIFEKIEIKSHLILNEESLENAPDFNVSQDSRLNVNHSIYCINQLTSNHIFSIFELSSSNRNHNTTNRLKLRNLSIKLIKIIEKLYKIFNKDKFPSKQKTVFDLKNSNHQLEWRKIVHIFNDPKNHNMLEYLKKRKNKYKETFFRNFYSEEFTQSILRGILNVIFDPLECKKLCEEFGFSCCNLNEHSSQCIDKWGDLEYFLKINYFKEIEVVTSNETHFHFF